MATHKLRFFQYMEVAAWLAQINKSKDSLMAYGQVSVLFSLLTPKKGDLEVFKAKLCADLLKALQTQPILSVTSIPLLESLTSILYQERHADDLGVC